MPNDRRGVTVLIVDDRPLFADALAIALRAEPGIAGAAVASHIEAADRAAGDRPGVALVDTDMPGTEGPELVRSIKARSPDTAVLVLRDQQSQLAVATAVEAGAAGYVRMSEPVSSIAQTIRRAAAGDGLIGREEARDLLRLLRHRRGDTGSAKERADRLTRREIEILQRMADGLDAPRIAFVLGVSPNTLRTHVQNILTKLGVHSKTEALAFAIRQGKVQAH